MKKGESDPGSAIWRCPISYMPSRFDPAERSRRAWDTVFRVRISPEDAISQFEKAIQRGFATAEVHNNLGYCLMYRSRFAEAEMHLDKALQLKPNFQAAIHNRGMVPL